MAGRLLGRHGKHRELIGGEDVIVRVLAGRLQHAEYEVALLARGLTPFEQDIR
jgi:hypothetical protein